MLDAEQFKINGLAQAEQEETTFLARTRLITVFSLCTDVCIHLHSTVLTHTHTHNIRFVFSSTLHLFMRSSYCARAATTALLAMVCYLQPLWFYLQYTLQWRTLKMTSGFCVRWFRLWALGTES